ncbi:hypothetical protein THASP1DRAFT_32050 [Thamnocephalis sphaerospora]|uniref:CSN8/PSMD8/EIF3K domain-containing protein n=1 Tax=Thamnocephalis sphaerospora TaxID=78915 RepID=A0A4P9XK11_9FUNG|nr:hypothetical protein THASP1DRAFT_32050 [Thamnocephalis sphaerospora]|eukprot:RKP06128.1 hypothetical protein THASP1DRAFT_32050 [Thamnocephalis sphaerospora]
MAATLQPLANETSSVLGLLQECENVEAQYPSLEMLPPSERAQLNAITLACLIALGRVSEARLLWSSLQGQTAKSELGALWALARAVAAGSGARDAVYRAAAAHSWTPVVASVVARLVDDTRRAALVTLGNAYEELPSAVAATQLGLSEPQAVQALTQAGWTKGAAAGVFNRPSAKKSLNTIQDPQALFTEHILHLEKF